MRDTVVRTRAGDVRGRWSDEVACFLGIPYATAGRFEVPTPVAPWDGVRDALAFGPTAPGAELLPSEYGPSPKIPGDEWLNLNVWTPSLTGDQPVLVWIHGGANTMGSSAQPVFDGTAFARDGVVFVSVNYRLGVEGFGQLPDAPANRGRRDQIAALEWVRDNISAFGGDPGNVTVAGISAGAGAVLALLSLDTGLFRRAVIQSGLLHSAHAANDAALVTAEVARRACVEPTAAALRAVDPDKLAGLAHAVDGEVGANPDAALWGASVVATGMGFSTVIDGSLVTGDPWQRVLDGVGEDMDLLVGLASDELLRMLPGAPDQAAALTDAMFRRPVHELAAGRAGRTFVYEFGWPSPLPGVGAAHGLDVGFVFDTLGNCPLEGDDPPQRLADTVHRAWVEFVRDGNPGWPAYPSTTRFESPDPV
ncbi:carboxylesterase/lipase family protein [Kutzneria sp. CA-103260]|uniref:carboxylesterase/lipase family protein n=1 Tax=Kutzneria sp. CA-103260 TaxID=2802641 RepID=UPI001BAD96B7|nr:carboxylesterase family protein [Kutzneria sp. CA-103260]QUQ65789.1 carboxylesterase [Kutzneria sp. CA-103260]